jgi:electron transfer flavoprotein alpha subunit
MNILILAEHDSNTVKKATLQVISAARMINNASISVLVAGNSCEEIAKKLAKVLGVKEVLVAGSKVYQHQLPENLAKLIAEIGQEKNYIFAPATTFGKNILPRVAALLEVAQISEVTKILPEDTFEHPIYAGNAIETVQSLDKIKVCTIRPTAFEPSPIQDNQANIKNIKIEIENTQTTWQNSTTAELERPELNSAEVVISGGRGLQSGENFKLIEQLAEKLNAAVGASRAAVDAGFVPNEYQVGQTGHVVAPRLYIAIGISGAIQHVAGIKDSKVIVAINKDPQAPIFEVADYGLVGDLFEIVPELIQKIEKINLI